MTNLYKRNKTYYARFNINNKLSLYFDNQKLYIKSLGVQNKTDATIIIKYLIAKFNFIKKNLMLLKPEELKNIIDDFKNINYEDILNRNHNLSLEHINLEIDLLNEPLTPQSNIIKDELYDLMQLAHIKHNKEVMWDMDAEDIELFINYIKKIKLKALIELKGKINSNITIEQQKAIKEIKQEDTGVTISEALEEFYNTRKHMRKTTFEQAKAHTELFKDYCKNHNIIYIKKLVNKDLINFRTYLLKNKNNKTSTINNTLTSIKTFLNFCLDTAHYIQYKITNNIMLQKTVKEKIEDKVLPWTNEDITKIFHNMKILTHNIQTKVSKKYGNEYEMIIKIGLYTGMRQNEIIQLTKQDIKFSEQYNTWYIDININDDKDIKNINSIRTVPIHLELQEDLLNYIKSKRKYLFEIDAKTFSRRFSDYKNKLGYPKNKKVFHSFRHTLSNSLKQNLTDNVLINELTGHAQDESAKMSETYTNKFSLDILKNELNKISFKDFIVCL